MTTTPTHLRPGSCFVCGSVDDHGQTFTETGEGHNFWSNAQAHAHFLAEARRQRSFSYSTGETTVEGQYVATTRGR